MTRRTLIARSPGAPIPTPPHRRPLVLAIAGVALVALVTAGIVLLTRGSSEPVRAGAPTSELASTAPRATTTVAASTTAATAAVTTSTAATTAVPTSTTAAASTAATGTTTASAGPPPTLADGSWEPIVAVFDTDKVTLTGSVPSAAAQTRLDSLATANSKTHAPVDDQTTIDPRAPANIGVRVIELTSTRFPSGSASILPAQATEFDRVVTVMKALPNITVLVIGHADQIGTSGPNLTLSQERAQSVVDYLELKGIEPGRLTSRGVGSTDLLTVDTSKTALALNRRTEFVFYGLLVGA